MHWGGKTFNWNRNGKTGGYKIYNTGIKKEFFEIYRIYKTKILIALSAMEFELINYQNRKMSQHLFIVNGVRQRRLL